MSFLVILLFLTSCINHSNWQSSHIYSQEKNHTSQKFTFLDPTYKEIELEIIAYSDHTKCYLNFFDLSLHDEKDIILVFKTDDLEFKSIGYCLKGGQRVLISEDGSVKLIEFLQKGKNVCIIHNDIQLDVPAENFRDLFNGQKNRFKKLITHFF